MENIKPLTSDISKRIIPKVKPRWVKALDDNCDLYFEKLKLHNDKIGDIFVEAKKDVDGYNRKKIMLTNIFGKELGTESYSIDGGNHEMTGFLIQAAPEYRQKNYGFGKMMRLMSIMTMKENKSPLIKIYSKDKAIYFHAKYKFEPAITAFSERDSVLKIVASDQSKGFEDLAEKAKDMLWESKTNDTGEFQRNLCKRANMLIKDYLERALKEENPSKSHPFNWGMSMVLKNETIEKFKNYFNDLFDK